MKHASVLKTMMALPVVAVLALAGCGGGGGGGSTSMAPGGPMTPEPVEQRQPQEETEEEGPIEEEMVEEETPPTNDQNVVEEEEETMEEEPVSEEQTVQNLGVVTDENGNIYYTGNPNIFFIPPDHPCQSTPDPATCITTPPPGSSSLTRSIGTASTTVALSGVFSFNELGDWATISGSTLAFGYHDDKWTAQGTATSGPSSGLTGTASWSGHFIGDRKETNPRAARGDVAVSMDLSSELRSMTAAFTNMRTIEADETTTDLDDRSFTMVREDSGDRWSATGIEARFYAVGGDAAGAVGGTMQDQDVTGAWGAVKD